jgi:DNA-binding CsgD family transcriptional regulator
MSFLERLLATLIDLPSPRRLYQFDDELIESLQELAAREQRSEQDVAQDLLAAGLAQRNAAEAFVQIWHELTRREQQMVALTCLSYTNREIAARLSLSPETVKSHVRSALHKFGVRTKADLRRLLSDWDFSDWK